MKKITLKKTVIVMAVFCITLLAMTLSVSANGQETSAGWTSYQFLLGDWIGEGGGNPGQGSGTFSFYPDLQKKILVRKNHCDFPATKDKPAFSHDDLMIIYQEQGKPGRAIYFDNEGHIINYMVEFSKDQNTLTFLSDLIPSAPRFRLSYIKGDNDTVKIKFEIASPAKPDTFSVYLESVAHKK
jgi:hypothetical protein